MTVLERKKFKVIHAVINDTDSRRVTAIERLYEPEPCTYTAEKLRSSVHQRTENFYSGKMELIPHDELKKKKKII